jgi:hypothetical protein
MPFALDATEIFEYVISTDRTKPKEQRPALLFHYPTCREARQIARAFDEADKAEDVEQSIKMRCDAIRLILCGWKHFVHRNGNPVAYDPAQLDTILTDTDITELHQILLKDMSLSEIEKKRAALSMQSGTAANSAKDATPANA